MQFTPVIKILMLINVAVYILQTISLDLFGIDLDGIFALFYVGSPYFKVFQPFTYMFLHGGFTHLFFNMFALWMFGRVIEQVWGAKRFLVYYIVCGLGAALVHELCQWTGIIDAYVVRSTMFNEVHQYIPTVGASGAVYGVLLAFGMLFPEERIFIMPIPVPIKAKWLITLYVFIEIAEGLMGGDGVAHFAHLGGMLVGFFIILYWRHSSTRTTVNIGRDFWRHAMGQTKQNVHVYQSDNYVRDYTSNSQEHQYNAQRKMRDEEIDRILDKVRKGGYQSLTESEKKTLFDASQR